MFSRLGVIIFCLGITMADSECLLIPIAAIALGAALYKIGEARGEQEGWLAEKEETDE